MVRFVRFSFLMAALGGVAAADPQIRARFLQGNNDNETVTIDMPPTMNNTENEPPMMNNTETEPPMMNNTETEPPMMNNTETEPPMMNNTETEPPMMNNTETEPTMPPVDLFTVDDVILSEPDLSTLAMAFNLSGLVGVLCDNCNYTVFAPTNDAFAAVDNVTLAHLLEPSWIKHLRALLSFHATQPTENRTLSSDLENGMVLSMLNNEDITLGVTAEGVTLTGEYFNTTNVVEADIEAENGVVHKVDALLIPEFLATDLVGLANTTAGENFTILFNYFEILDVGSLLGNRIFTVFAPTDEAFKALGEETLKDLETNTGELQKILVNHVVQGIVSSDAVTDGLTAKSFGGVVDLYFSVTSGDNGTSAMVNDANIVVVDVLANNGIVHAIDKVLVGPYTPPGAPTGAITPMAVPTSNGAPAAPSAPVKPPVRSPTAATPTSGVVVSRTSSVAAMVLAAVVVALA